MASPTGQVQLIRQDTNQVFFLTNIDPATGAYSVSTNAMTGVALPPPGVPVIARYLGDPAHLTSDSAPVNDIVNAAAVPTTTTLAITPNPANTGDTQTFSGTVV